MKLELDIVRRLMLVGVQHDGPEWETSISNVDYQRFYAASKLVEAGYFWPGLFPAARLRSNTLRSES